MLGDQNTKPINATLRYFPAAINRALLLLDPAGKLSRLYLKWLSLLNYAVVCGIGIGINTYVLYGLVNLFPLWLANFCAILTAFLWNWTMSVGPLGYLWGLSPRRTK